MAEMNMMVLSRRCRFLPGEFFTVMFPSAFALATMDESVGQTPASAATVLESGWRETCDYNDKISAVSDREACSVPVTDPTRRGHHLFSVGDRPTGRSPGNQPHSGTYFFLVSISFFAK